MADTEKKKEESSWLSSFLANMTLGDGMAENAKQKLESRGDQIDALLDDAMGVSPRKEKKDKKEK